MRRFLVRNGPTGKVIVGSRKIPGWDWRRELPRLLRKTSTERAGTCSKLENRRNRNKIIAKM